jgi:hypothetical protein
LGWVALTLLAFAPPCLTLPRAAAQTPPASEPTGSTPAPAASAPATSGTPQVEEWINQSLTVREAATVYVAPDEASESHGRLAPGHDVRVIATLAGGGWLQVRLPDDTIGYVKATAVALASAAPPAEAPQPADTTGAAPPNSDTAQTQPPPAAAEQPGGAAPPAPAPGGDQAAVRPDMPTPAGLAPPAPIDGRPLVRDTATLVIDGKAVLLAGVEGVSGEAPGVIQDHIAAHGDRVSCSPAPDMPGYYTCRLADGTDLAKLLLVNGIARIAAGAPDDYAPQQEAAVTAQKGIWALPDTCARWAISDSVATVAFTDDADEGLYFYNREPFVLAFGEPVPIVFDAVLGWGFYGAGGRWTAAPARWSAHLNNVYPNGRGLRDAAARAQDLRGGAVRGAALHEAEAHQRPIEQQHALAEKLGHSTPIAPENARPRALEAGHTSLVGGGARPEVQHEGPQHEGSQHEGPQHEGPQHEGPTGASRPEPHEASHGAEPEAPHPQAAGFHPTSPAPHPLTPMIPSHPAATTPMIHTAPMTHAAPVAPHVSTPPPKTCKKPPC